MFKLLAAILKKGYKIDIEKLDKENSVLKNRNANLEKHISDLQDTIQNIENHTIPEYQQKLKKSQSYISDLQKGNVHIKESISKIKQEFQIQTSELDELNKSLKEKNSLEKILQDSKQKLVNSNKICIEKERLITNLQNRILELENFIESKKECDNVNIDLKHQLETLQKNYQEQCSKYEETISQLHEEIDKLHEEIDSLTIDKVLENPETDEEEINLQDEIVNCEKKIQILTEKKEELAKESREKDAKIAALTEDVQKLKEEKKKDKEQIIRFKTRTAPASLNKVENDLPNIQPVTTSPNRSIKYVLDLDTGEKISSEDFFHKDIAEISEISRRIEVIQQTGKQPHLVCAKCGTPVKISKTTTSLGETLFFTHAFKDVECEWKSQIHSTFLNVSEPEVDIVLTKRYHAIKDLLFQYFKAMEKEPEKYHIHCVGKNVVIKAKEEKHKNKQRIADIYLKYNDYEIVISLLTADLFLKNVVDHDLFYQENGIYSLWIFGCDSGHNYDYLKRVVFQNTLFANKRNVFIIDDETEKKIETDKTVVFKCNWLEDDGTWHYSTQKNGTNGIFVTIGDLKFDNKKTYFPYYHESSDNHIVDDGIYKTLINAQGKTLTNNGYLSLTKDNGGGYKATRFDENLNEISGKLNKDGVEIADKEKSLQEGKKAIRIFGKWGLKEADGTVSIKPEYDSLENWSSDKYIIMNNGKYGIIDKTGKILLQPEYDEIEQFSTGHNLKVRKHNKIFYINKYGLRVDEDKVILQDNLIKFKRDGKWGIKDNTGKLIIKNSYNEIGSFRNRLYGFTDDEIVKFDVFYNFPIKVKSRYIGQKDKLLKFNIKGVECHMAHHPEKALLFTENTYYHLSIENITGLHSSPKVFLKEIEDKDLAKPGKHVDKDTDFELDGEYTGTVTSKKKANKRITVRIDNGKETYLSFHQVTLSGMDPQDFPPNTKIRLKKINFDKYYDRTIWKVLP